MKQKNVATKNFFTTRPCLASRLILAGYAGHITVNVYNPERPAWEFERKEGLQKIVDAYFKELESREGKQ